MPTVSTNETHCRPCCDQATLAYPCLNTSGEREKRPFRSSNARVSMLANSIPDTPSRPPPPALTPDQVHIIPTCHAIAVDYPTELGDHRHPFPLRHHLVLLRLHLLLRLLRRDRPRRPSSVGRKGFRPSVTRRVISHSQSHKT